MARWQLFCRTGLLWMSAGVGFQVLVSIRDAADMPPAGSEVKVYTYLSVSEDAIRLYGFPVTG